MAFALQVLILILHYLLPALGNIFDLSELEWTLKNENGSIVIPAKVPSQAHLDLLSAGIITEPLLGINDFTQRWIVYDNWTYTASLAPFLNTLTDESSKILLVFYGLDTIANISLLGTSVAWVNNEFREYVFDVTKPVLYNRCGTQNITIAFESAYKYGQNVSSRPDAEVVPGGDGDFEFPGVRQWIRKIASDFGWDWGPAFVPSGIYKKTYLVSLSKQQDYVLNHPDELDEQIPLQSIIQSFGTPPYSPPATTTTVDYIFIEDMSLDIYKIGQNFSNPPDEAADWTLNLSLAIRSASLFKTPTVTFSISELNLSSSAISLSPILNYDESPTWVNATWSIPDSVPLRWFPHNLATGPKLYDIQVFLILSDTITVMFPVRTGFRTIQLVQSPYSQEEIMRRGITPGDQWHFKINGMSFYSMGTNIIPFDPFYPRIDPEMVRWILESAVKSGQNMLRVWGGGIYQPSSALIAGGMYDFYSLCDEMGILAWSEFIFSDALYPVNDFMLKNIEPEVRQNVRRVNKHPSNVQWAGGNEIEGMVTYINNTLWNGTLYLNEFVFLFQDFLKNITTSETRSVPYTDCSTTHGVLSLDPYILRFNNGTPGYIYGNGERYNYDASEAFDLESFPNSRFMNEFGFHSMPSFYSWEEVLTSPEDFSFNSTVVMSRDHHPAAGDLAFPNPNAPEGQREMTAAVELWLPTPSTANSNQTFAQWCYSTQIFQCMTMVAQIAWYRRGAGEGSNNLGALVWQLNDVWQGISWSSIEYSGRWKVLNYGLSNAFTSVVINPFWTPQTQTLEILVTSDRWTKVEGTAQLTWYDWKGNELKSSTHEYIVPPLNNSVIFNISGWDAILPIGRQPSDVWLLLNSTAIVEGSIVTSEQYFNPTSLANVTLFDPKIQMQAKANLTFTLLAEGAVSPWTWIDHPSKTVGVFVDNSTGKPINGFYLIRGIQRTVKFIVNNALSEISNPEAAEFVVRSLWNSTHS